MYIDVWDLVNLWCCLVDNQEWLLQFLREKKYVKMLVEILWVYKK